MRTWEDPISPVKRRIGQYDIQPTAIKPAALAQTTLVNTNSEILGPVSLSDGGNISVISIINNTSNVNFRLGALPYGIVFFEDALTIGSIIGGAVSGYIINGPMAMPEFEPLAADGVIGGTDGNNLVFLTEIINDTGNPHDIYVITNTRVYTPAGGSAT